MTLRIDPGAGYTQLPDDPATAGDGLSITPTPTPPADEPSPYSAFAADLVKKYSTTAVPPASPYQDAANALKLRDMQTAQAAARMGAIANPSQNADAGRLASQFNADPGLVLRNLDEFKRRETELRASTVLSKNPALAGWYAKGNYDFVDASELEKLSGASWLFNATGAAYGEGTGLLSSSLTGYRQFKGEATPEEIARANEIDKRAPIQYGANSWIQNSAVQFAKWLPQAVFQGALTARGFLGGATAGGLAGLASGGPVVAAAGAAIGGPVGAGYGAWEASHIQNVGQDYRSNLALKDADGNPMDPTAAKVGALISGTINGVLDVASEAVLGSVAHIPGVSKAISGIVSKGVASALVRPTGAHALATFGKNVLVAGGTEVGTETLQTAISLLAQDVAKKVSGGKFDPATAGDWADQLGQTVLQTAQMMTILGPAAALFGFAHDMRQARAAARAQENFKAVTQQAANDTLVKRDPARAAEAVNAASPGEVLIAPERMTELFQSANVTPADMDRVIPQFSQRLAEAHASGADLAISNGDFYAHLAGTPLGEAMTEHLRTTPDGMSAFDARAFNEAWDAAKEEIFAEADKVEKAASKTETAADYVYHAVKEKLIASGERATDADAYGKLYSRMFAVMGERSGVDPAELYKSYGFDVKRELPGVAAFQRTGQLELAIERVKKGEDAKAMRRVDKRRGKSLLDWIVERGGVTDPGGELRASDAAKYRRGKLLAKEVAPGGGLLPETEAGRVGGKNANSLDSSALDAWEAGYFPEHTERPSVNDMIEAIREGLAGKPRYTSTVEDVATPDEAHLIQVSKEMDRLGLLPTDDTASIAAALRGVASDESEAGALYQTTVGLFRDVMVGGLTYGNLNREQMRAMNRAVDQGDWSVVELPVSRLVATQENIDDDFKTAAARHAEKYGADDLPLVIRVGGVNFIRDGHHRAAAAGDKVKVRLVDLDAVPHDPRQMTLFQPVYHGSPHIFDEFSLHKIGTGEGAQAYGWGLYFAGKKEIAEYYRDTLAGGPIRQNLYQIINEYNPAYINTASNSTFLDAVAVAAKDGPEAVTRAILSVASKLRKSKWDSDRVEADSIAALAGDVGLAKAISEKARGRLYHVEIPDDGEYLLWDKPLSEQPEKVKAAYVDVMRKFGNETPEETILSQNITGRQIYEDVGSQVSGRVKGNAQAASEALAAAGIPGIKYLAGTSRSAGEGDYNYVLFDDKLAKIVSYEQQNRGSIQFTQGRTLVNLFQHADRSTFLHETGHFFLEVLRDVATREGAPADLVADWDAVKKWTGAADDQVSVDAHEKFARGFEAYLFEGKAPSEAVAGIFARFSAWLRMVYRDTRRLNVKVPKEIAAVMDRMIASSTEIEEYAGRSEFRPSFATAEEAGMTPKQFAAYQEDAKAAVEDAKAQLTARMMEEVRRETSQQWRDAKKEVRAEVEDELSRVPIFQASHYLKTGQFLRSGLEHTPEQRLRLDRDALAEMFGLNVLAALPRAKPPIYKKGGVHPDVIAELFGMESGHSLVEALMSTPSYTRAVADETMRRMRDRFGDLASEQDRRAEAARAAIDNDARGKLLEAEWKVLIKKGALNTRANRQAAERAATELIGRKTVREATRVSLYEAAAQKAAKRAEHDILTGDWVGAAAWKQRQIFNHYLARAARQAVKDVEKIQRHLSKFTGGKRPDGINPEHVLRIEELLERFDLRKSVTGKQIANRQSFADWLNEQEAQGALVAIPDELRNEAFRVSYKELPVEDLRALDDAVGHIEHLGRRWYKVRTDQGLREFAAVRDEVVGQIRSIAERKKSPNRNPDKKERWFDTFAGYHASLSKIENIIDWIDGGDVNGPLRRVIWKPLSDAVGRENDLMEQYTAKLHEIIDKFKPGHLAQTVTIDGVTWKRSDLMAVMLNTGSESNYQKMLEGEKNRDGSKWTPQKIDDLISHLTKEETDAVQEIWDTVNSLWPEVHAIQKRLTGYEPEKIEARKVVTRHGEYRGGYYPIRYDPRGNYAVEQREAARADKLFENTYSRPDTPHGFTITRTKGAHGPILLDLRVLPNHLAQVIHDITHREAIQTAYKLLHDPAVLAEMDARVGPKFRQQFTPWLQAIANDREQLNGMQDVDSFINRARTNATTFAMGYKFSVSLAQFAGFFPVMNYVRLPYLVGAVKDFGRHPVETVQRVRAKSTMMRHRIDNVDRDIRGGLAALDGTQGVWRSGQKSWAGDLMTELASGRIKGLTSDMKRFAFHGIGYMDAIVSISAWSGAYDQHIAEHPGDEAGAIDAGDRAVTMSQGSGRKMDLSAIHRRSGLWRYLTMFYTPFSALYGQISGLARDSRVAVEARDIGSVPAILARAFYLVVGPAVIGSLLAGQGPDKDENWAAWVARQVLLYPTLAIPGIRDVTSALSSGYGYSFTPMAHVFESGSRMVGDVHNLIRGKPVSARRAAVHAATVLGYGLGLPISQPIVLGDNLWQAMNDGDFQLRDLIYRRQQSRQDRGP